MLCDEGIGGRLYGDPRCLVHNTHSGSLTWCALSMQ